MKVADGLVWVSRSVGTQKLRSLLTMVGFAIGIGAVVLLGSLGEGLRRYVMDEFTQFGTTILAVTPGKTETLGVAGILNTTRPLSLSDSEALARLPGVDYVVPVVMGTAEISTPDRGRSTNVAGVGPRALEVWKLEMHQGAFLPDEDLERARPMAVLGYLLKQELFGDANAINQFVDIGGSRFRVVGVTAPKGQLLGFDMDDIIYVPAARGLQLFNRESLMEVDVFYSPTLSTEVATSRVSNTLIQRHGVEDFTIVTQDEMLETMDSIMGIIALAGAGLGGISLLVGAVGIGTILMITVAERTPEVGLLRALGATRRQVRLLFLGEAAFLGLVGGLAGLLLVVLIKLVLVLALPTLPMAIHPQIVIVALVISVAVGMLAGLKPASSAVRLSPIDALRSE